MRLPLSDLRSAAGLPLHLANGEVRRVVVHPGPRADTLELRGTGVHLVVPRQGSLVPGETYLLKIDPGNGVVVLHHVADAAGGADATGASLPGRNATGPPGPVFPENTADLVRIIVARSQRRDPGVLASVLLQRFSSLHRYRVSPADQRRLARTIRGTLELRDREIHDPPDDLSELVAGVAGASGRREDPGHRRGASGESSGKQAEEGGSLGAYLRRTTSVANHPLHLYNHISPTAGLHWVTIPIRANAPRLAPEAAMVEGVEGVLRVGWNAQARRTEQAVLTIERPGGCRWWFCWELPSARLVRCHSDGEPIPPQLLARAGKTSHTDSTSGSAAHAVHRFFDGFPDAPQNGSGVDLYG